MKVLSLAVLSVVVAFLMFKPVARIPLRIAFDYNEGWNAYYAERAVSGESLYPDKDDLLINNYPPLSFYFAGIVSRLTGDAVIAGRILSLAGLLLSTTLLAILVRRFTGDWYYGLLFALLEFGYMCAFHSDYIGMSDPHWLAQGVMMVGLWGFLEWRGLRWGLALTTAIMLAAGMIKHNFIAVPLGCAVWLWWHERTIFPRYIVMMLTAGVVGVLVIHFACGENALFNILCAPRSYKISQIVAAGPWLQPAVLYLACVVVLLSIENKKEICLLILISGISLLSGVIVIGGAGAYSNHLFEAVSLAIALSVILLHHVLGTQRGWFATGAVILAFPFLLVFPVRMFSELNWYKELPTIRTTTAAEIDLIAKAPGNVMCENLALAYWAGKPFCIDFFSVGQKLATGKLGVAPLLVEVERRKIGLIQLDDSSGACCRIALPVLRRMQEGMSKTNVSEYGVFFIRK